MKRVLILVEGQRYQKTLHGPLATEAQGLASLRAACPHFNRWVSALESL